MIFSPESPLAWEVTEVEPKFAHFGRNGVTHSCFLRTLEWEKGGGTSYLFLRVSSYYECPVGPFGAQVTDEKIAKCEPAVWVNKKSLTLYCSVLNWFDAIIINKVGLEFFPTDSCVWFSKFSSKTSRYFLNFFQIPVLSLYSVHFKKLTEAVKRLKLEGNRS